jgi:dihydropteroate synthase
MADLSKFHWGEKTYVMGIINVTPDSFSGDGILTGSKDQKKALDQVRNFINSGVDIIDIGGESTRPGARVISWQEEMDRIIPIVKAVRKETYLPISVDTYKSEVAQAALSAGADWINDVWGLRADPKMAVEAARANAPLILMHNRSKPVEAELQTRLGGRYVGAVYNDLIADISAELLDSVNIAIKAGIQKDHIIIDPGIGFGKTIEQNLELINRLDEICALGYPVLFGPSRKSFIGYTLDLPPSDRLEGTAAAVAVGIVRGASIVRVHDVLQIVRVSRMTDGITRMRKSPE